MPLLDAIQLFVSPDISLNDTTTIAGRTWSATLQYVIHLDGLAELYTSKGIEDNTMWVILGKPQSLFPSDSLILSTVWKNKESHSAFHRLSLGISMMLYFMEKSPVVLSMPEIPDGALRNGTDIGAIVLRVEKRHQQQQTTHTKITVIYGDHKCKAYTAWQTQEVSA
jgi:hypothetical protein